MSESVKPLSMICGRYRIESPEGHAISIRRQYTAIGIVWMSNGCCKGRPVVVTTNKRVDGAINYSCQCACDMWCTSGHDTAEKALDEYAAMTRRELARQEKY